MVAGLGCPLGTIATGVGSYGAENMGASSLGFLPYKVEYSSLLSTYRLVRDQQPLRMTACAIP